MHMHRNGKGGTPYFSALVSDVRLYDIRERFKATGCLFPGPLLLLHLIHQARPPSRKKPPRARLSTGPSHYLSDGVHSVSQCVTACPSQLCISSGEDI